MLVPRSNRDLSLENLLLTVNGEVRIIDFGMALKVPRGRDGRAGLMLPQVRIEASLGLHGR